MLGDNLTWNYRGIVKKAALVYKLFILFFKEMRGGCSRYCLIVYRSLLRSSVYFLCVGDHDISVIYATYRAIGRICYARKLSNAFFWDCTREFWPYITYGASGDCMREVSCLFFIRLCEKFENCAEKPAAVSQSDCRNLVVVTVVVALLLL